MNDVSVHIDRVVCSNVTKMKWLFLILVVGQLGLYSFVKASPPENELCNKVKNATCPDPENIRFYLFTRQNPDKPQVLLASNISSSYFNATKPTKIVIHGFNSDADLYALVNIRKGYITDSDVNVVAVDWAELSQGSFLCYPTAIENGEHVGNCTAQLIKYMLRAGATDIHLIGFSLGAQVTAFISNQLRPYHLPRITGLDPAMPLFVTSDKDKKLDSGDANFVDVFHTNAFVQGKMEESGHVDFYFNGGSRQPGCGEDLKIGAFDFGCSHVRAAIYFAESITSHVGFWGWGCPSYLAYLMGLCGPSTADTLAGEHVSNNTRGFYLVNTASTPPYALGPDKKNKTKKPV